MNQQDIIEAILEFLPKSIVAVDRNHVIIYMNKAARIQHTNLVGESLLDCHNKDSILKIYGIAQRLETNEDQILLKEDDGFIKSYFLAIRDKNGQFAGYYEMMDKRS